MNQLTHKFLEDDERGRTIIAATGLCAGVILLTVAVFSTFFLR